MDGRFELTEDEFDELSLHTQLGALYRQSRKNHQILEDIRTSCDCRKRECEDTFVTTEEMEEYKNEIKRTLRTRNILSKAVAAGIAAGSGFLGGLLGGKTS